MDPVAEPGLGQLPCQRGGQALGKVFLSLLREAAVPAADLIQQGGDAPLQLPAAGGTGPQGVAEAAVQLVVPVGGGVGPGAELVGQLQDQLVGGGGIPQGDGVGLQPGEERGGVQRLIVPGGIVREAVALQLALPPGGEEGILPCPGIQPGGVFLRPEAEHQVLSAVPLGGAGGRTEPPPQAQGQAPVDGEEDGPPLLLRPVIAEVEGLSPLLRYLEVGAADQGDVGLRRDPGGAERPLDGHGLRPPQLRGDGLRLRLAGLEVLRRHGEEGVGVGYGPLPGGEHEGVGEHVGPAQAIQQTVLGLQEAEALAVTAELPQAQDVPLLVPHGAVDGGVGVLQAGAGPVGGGRDVRRHRHRLPAGAHAAVGLPGGVGIAALEEGLAHWAPPFPLLSQRQPQAVQQRSW